jgi:dTDP-glucose 4,6-dehydratase
MRVVLVTGGAGFIGGWVVRHLLRLGDTFVVNVDKLTYAADRDSVKRSYGQRNYHFEQADICDARRISALFKRFQPDAVMHLAAESHVDRSIEDPSCFIQTNIVGTCNLLEAARRHWLTLDGKGQRRFRFHHVSTDEVFGSLGTQGKFTETIAYMPHSPYSASKASSDHLVRSWHATYGLPIIITNCSNNYGPYQFPEKLIPLAALHAMLDRPIPLHGDGRHVRDWLYVEDHVRALLKVCNEGRIGETYNIGGNTERTNLEVVSLICDIVDELHPPIRQPRRSLIRFVQDRPGQDFRYAMDTTKIHDELGWSPSQSFDSALFKTVKWYMENRAWWQHIQQRGYLAKPRTTERALSLPIATAPALERRTVRVIGR